SQGADETVRARNELFLDIGDAIDAAAQPSDGIAAWVYARITARRHEPVILAAALNRDAAESLVHAAERGDHDLVMAAAAAARQHAPLSEEARDRLAGALAAD